MTHPTRRRPARLLALKLPEDPEAAFRIRLAADRAELVRLMARPRTARTLADLEELAHGLAGSAGVFGHDRVGDAAARLERLAERYRLQKPGSRSQRQKSLLAGAAASLLAALSASNRQDATDTE